MAWARGEARISSSDCSSRFPRATSPLWSKQQGTNVPSANTPICLSRALQKTSLFLLWYLISDFLLSFPFLRYGYQSWAIRISCQTPDRDYWQVCNRQVVLSRVWEQIFDVLHHFFIFPVFSSLVPKPENYAGSFLCCLGWKSHHLVHVTGKLSLGITLVWVEWELYLWGSVSRRSIALGSRVPLDVSTVLKPFSLAILINSGRRGCSRGSPIMWKYRKQTFPRILSVSRSNSSALNCLFFLVCLDRSGSWDYMY